MKRRDFIQLGSASAAGLTFAGIPMSVFAQGMKGGVLNSAIQPEPPSLNVGTHQNVPTMLVGGNIFEGLLRYDEKLQPIPCLATSWTVSPDGLTYIFKLKPNVKWHDGKPFTADDVVFSADVFDRKGHSRARGNLAMVQSIRTIDPLTVEFKLKTTFGAFLGIFAGNALPIVPKHVFDGATDFVKHPGYANYVGTGPFKFKEWVKGSYIHLVRFDDYHEKDLPLLDAIYFHVIPDAAARANAFESGKLDVLPGGSVENFDVARLAKLPGVAVTQKGWELFSPISHIVVNNRKAPMDSIKFRQALNLAIDREAMRKVAWYGFADVANGPFNSRLKFWNADLPKLARDKEQAKKLLAESGYKGETLRLMPLPYGETWQRLAEIARQNLADVSVKTELVPTDVAAWNSKMNEWDFDLAFTYIYGHGDPALGITRNYTTPNIAKGSPFNNAEGYSNPKVDELFDRGAAEMDPEKRRVIYWEVQKLLVAEMPVLWLHELNFPTVYRTKVNNLVNSGAGMHDSLTRTWMA
ncbi:peptide/nickel transport system substrate-binding protein [Variovorax sp. HW608]|uniref:ABC transporter substrate-binding protein n=1 Tax=Variovorax sp. HW608 TaxID=1034889 RepID=UPI00081FD236|nr:ABC transporter substrate-binding protein [Variovorax sp. HW608]SCK10148.1 peptide/nickel transport system substrate-binding protein [Variovorax sp. HW608]